MGGGGAMRTAAKIVGFGVGRTGFRGAPTAHPAEQSVRNATRQAHAAVSSQGTKPAEVALPAPSWELDDWEFTDDTGDLVMAAGEPMPRVVFGGVPNFDEAKEATTELKEAIDKIYLSSESSHYEDSSPGSQVSALSRTYVEPETKSHVIEGISNPSVPKHAIQAFQLLSTSPQVQSVVASIACDPNVWNAVMQNPGVHDFFQSHKKVAGFDAHETRQVEEFADHAAAKETHEEVTLLPESQSAHDSFDFVGLLQNLKLSVSEMVSKVSNYLQNIFPTAEKEKDFADADGTAKANFWDSNKIMGGTFIGLASLVIMVVLVKRA